MKLKKPIITDDVKKVSCMTILSNEIINQECGDTYAMNWLTDWIQPMDLKTQWSFYIIIQSPILKLFWLLIWYWDQSFFVSLRQILQHHPSRSQWRVKSNSFQIIYWFFSKGFKAFWTEPKKLDLRKILNFSK